MSLPRLRGARKQLRSFTTAFKSARASQRRKPCRSIGGEVEWVEQGGYDADGNFFVVGI